MTITHKTTLAFLWNLFERFYTQILKFFSGILIARILIPSDYGLIAMLSIFLVVSQSFSEGGFLNALIQKNKFSEADSNNVFLFNLILSSFFFGVFYYIAPHVSTYFNEPELTQLLRVISIVGVLNAISIVPRACLHVKLDFKTQAKGTTLAVTISSLIGISLAYNKCGVWSLVFQSISLSLINTLYLYYVVPWRPRFIFSINEFKELFSFGSQILIANLIDRIFKNIYNIVIAKNYNSFQLGLFNRAEQFSQLPSSNIAGVIQNVSFPSLSKFKEDNISFKSLYIWNSRLACLITFPILLFISFYSEPIVLISLTSKWIDAVPFLQLLALVWLFYPINFLNMNIFLSRKKGKMYIKIELVKKIISGLLLVLTYKLGIIYIIYGQAISSMIILFINFFLVEKEIDYKFKQQIFDFTIFLIIAFFSICFSKLVTNNFDNNILTLLIGFISVTIVYVTTIMIFNPRNIWTYIKNMRNE